MRDLERFLAHLEDPSPGFRCAAAGDEKNRLSFSVRVSHRRGRKASAADLKRLTRALGATSGDVGELYARHDGLALYSSPLSGPALRFFPIRGFASQTRRMRRWEEDAPPASPRMRRVAIGEVVGSGDYLAVVGTRLFLVPHDGPADPLGRLGPLLGVLARDPVAAFARLGASPRYFDGRTRRQWIPVEYVRDLRDAPPLGKPRPHLTVWAFVRFASGKELSDVFHNQGGLLVSASAEVLADEATRRGQMTVDDFLDSGRSSPKQRQRPLVALSPECDRVAAITLRLGTGKRTLPDVVLKEESWAGLPPSPSALDLAELLVQQARLLMRRASAG